MSQLAFLANIMAIAGTYTVLVLAAAFLPESFRLSTILSFLGLLLAYGLTFHLGQRWRAEPEPARTEATLRRHTRLILAIGVLWGVLLVELVLDADGGQRSLLYAVAVGALSTSVLYTPTAVALALWAPLSVGGFVTLGLAGHWTDLLTALCLLGYVLLTLFCILHLNRSFIERAVNAIRLEQQGEVIRLLLREFEENSGDWLWETDGQLRLKHVSARLAEAARRPASALSGLPLLSLAGGAGAAETGAQAARSLARSLENRSAFRDLVVPVRIGGEECWWSLAGKPVFDRRGAFAGYRGVGSDVTVVRRSEERVAYLARYDTLTALPNRVLFNEALEQACGRESIALLCLDLDEFKTVNDTLGHATGDRLLAAVADRLRGCLRQGDVAARLGGDEFAVILAVRDAAEAAATAGRIIEQIGQPYWFDGVLVEIGVSIGMTLAPRDGTRPERLLKNADLALYRAKAEGRGLWRFFEPAMDRQVQERWSLQADLRHALARGEFRLMFQPILDLASLRVVSAEVLLRWLHPERGLVAAPDFIPIAEKTGLIGAIGAWVIREACMEATRWPESVTVSVNLSAVQFRDARLVETVAEAVAQSGLAASRLELEITESILLARTEQTLDILHRLRALGMRIALDDFGTGYSSLSYLRSFPFDKIKIDRSFIQDLETDRDFSAIIRAITRLARSIGIATTAEGVETEAQLALLRGCGCTQVQGFLFGQPRPAREIGAWIAAHSGGCPSPLVDGSRAAIG